MRFSHEGEASGDVLVSFGVEQTKRAPYLNWGKSGYVKVSSSTSLTGAEKSSMGEI